MKKLILIIFTTFSLSVFADHHESAPMTTDGAFTTLMIAASDINKYTETLSCLLYTSPSPRDP